MDADLQDPPELILQMITQWKNGYDVVLAQRTTRDGEPWIRKLVARTAYWIIRRIVVDDTSFTRARLPRAGTPADPASHDRRRPTANKQSGQFPILIPTKAASPTGSPGKSLPSAGKKNFGADHAWFQLRQRKLWMAQRAS